MKTYKQPIRGTKEAYQAIHDFFSCFHLHEALQETERLFKWACKEKYYNKSAPADIIFLSQQLYKLFTAVEIIYYSNGKKASAILYVATTEKSLTNELLNVDTECAKWESHTRHLSFEEYLNPYWMFEKFAEMHKWEEALEELMEAALSNGSIEGSYKIGEVMNWRERMMGVVEGGWLVERRLSTVA